MKLSILVMLVAFSIACTKADDKHATIGSGSSAPGAGSAIATPPPAGSAVAAGSDVTVTPAEKPLAVGDRISAQWTDGRWYPGKIAAVRPDGTYDINYNDGDKSSALPGTKIRRPGSHPAGTSHAHSSGGGDAPCPGTGLMRRCSGRCVNIQEDNNNCGSCGNKCPSGKSCDGHMFCRDAAGNL